MSDGEQSKKKYEHLQKEYKKLESKLHLLETKNAEDSSATDDERKLRSSLNEENGKLNKKIQVCTALILSLDVALVGFNGFHFVCHRKFASAFAFDLQCLILFH